MFLLTKKISLRNNFKCYSKFSLEQLSFSIVEANRQLQMTSAKPVSGSDDSNLNTSLIPFKLIGKDIATLYDVPPSTKAFEKYELLFSFLKTSPHAQNLKEREGVPNLTSFSFGQNQFYELFSKIGLYPPQVICFFYFVLISSFRKSKTN
jgi:hypothetical protein